MARRNFVSLLGGSALLSLSGCGYLNSRASYRFRMTVEVDTPQGIKSGSSVYEVLAEKNNTRVLAEERAGGTRTRGQALIVDLPSGPLFVLLATDTAGESLGSVATYALAGENARGGIDHFLPAVRKLGGWFSDYKAELPRENWPMMVRFSQINDPTTIEKVDPQLIGVKRIVVETTDDDVTNGIENRIPWLPNIYKMEIGSDFRPNGIPLGNFKRLFSTEIE